MTSGVDREVGMASGVYWRAIADANRGHGGELMEPGAGSASMDRLYQAVPAEIPRRRHSIDQRMERPVTR